MKMGKRKREGKKEEGEEREREGERERKREREEGEGEDFFVLLGVSRDASTADIRREYLKKAKLCHPDKTGEPDKARVRPLAFFLSFYLPFSSSFSLPNVFNMPA